MSMDLSREQDRNVSNLIDGLRDLADFLEENDSLHPYLDTHLSDWATPIKYENYLEDLDEVKDVAKGIGECEKEYDHMFTLRKQFGNGLVQLVFEASRQSVCKKIIKGKKERIIPERPAEPQRVITEDEIEWECPPSLLAD
jgi:hypothetical protein